MSLGCGSLASPSGHFPKGKNKAAASSNGVQHTLPENPHHDKIQDDLIKTHWDLKQSRGPTRLWGTVKNTTLGGYEHRDSTLHWKSGEFWNCDSNIRKWGEHEVRRNAAQMNHDIHRHDQYQRVVLPVHPGACNRSGKETAPRASNTVSADDSFLESFGFDLGQRDRQGKCIKKVWNPTRSGEMFRDERSYNRDYKRIGEYHKNLRRTISAPGFTLPPDMLANATMKPEDVGGEAGDMAHEHDADMMKAGRTHGSRSAPYWNCYSHTCRREGAKMCVGTMSPKFRQHNEHPFVYQLELNPAAVYTKKFKRFGEDGLRRHETPKQQEEKLRTYSTRHDSTTK